MKISKTLKRLRTEKGITQEALAEKLFISRQSVSSWENDRTQPDIEMLGKLAGIFEVSVEELIYGKKRNVTLETEKPNYNGTLLIVFSILGTLLAGTGIVLIFVHFWQKMPMFSKAILSFLPLLAGQASGLFVLIKRRDKLPWCEGASVLWTAGIAATLTMVYNIFDLGIYWYNLLIIVAVCIIPVIALLKCVAPLAVYYACTIAWNYIYMYEENQYFTIIFAILLIASGCVFTSRMINKENKSLRSIYSHWLSVAAVFAYTLFLSLVLDNIIFAISGTGALGLCLLIISLKEQDISMPYRIPGLLFTSIMLFVNGGIFFDIIDATAENILFTAITCLSLPLIFILTKGKVKDKFFISYLSVSTLSFLIFSIALYFFTPKDVENFGVEFLNLLKVLALIANILLMISGAKEKKLIPINIGFVSVAALTILIVSLSGLSLIGNGILLLIFGAILLAVNFRISRQKQKKPVSVINEEVSGDEK